MFDNSDEYDFSSADSSKLASLFGNIGQNNDELNSSLIYTPPKQPNRLKTVAKDNSNNILMNKSQSAVLLAKVVSLWKLEDREYKALGKHGLALIGSVDLKLFEIIAYKEKNNVLLRTKLNDNLVFYQQKNNFSSFYDDSSRNWLIKFENNDQKDFCESLKNCGAKIISSDETSQKNTQDIPTKPDLLLKPKLSSENSEEHSDSQQRALILNRMAKMGQQILPKPIRKSSSDISDSEIEENRCDRKLPARKVKKSPEKPSSELVSASTIVPTTSMGHPPNFPQGVHNPMLYAQPLHYEGLNHYIVAQNTELKMSIAQISAKLDSVLGSHNPQQTDHSALKSKMKALELQSDNLQEALGTYKKKCSILESKSRDHSEKDATISKLETEVTKLKSDLLLAEQQLEDFQQLKRELEQSKNDIKDCEKTIEIQKLKIKDFEEFYELNKDNKELQTTIDHLNSTVANLKLKLGDYEEYFKKNETDKEDRLRKNNEKINLLSEMIKTHMNAMYQSVLGSFSEEVESLSMPQVQSQVAKHLKRTTFQIIEEIKTICSEGTNTILNDQ